MATMDTPDSALTRVASLVRRLARPDAFPHPADRIEIIETHISWVILTGRYAYKVRKPVRLGFLDFSSLDARQRDCQEELRLNRRFAPDLYVDVVPIGGGIDEPIIGAEPVLEWAVRMRQFPADARLDRQLAAGSLSIEDMQSLGDYLADFHARSPAAPPGSEFGSAVAIGTPALDNFRDLERLLPGCAATGLGRLRAWTEATVVRLAETFNRRQRDGRVRECHGDLHLANLVRLDETIVAFDCLEFDAKLRWIDVMSDVSFLLMDLMHRARAELGFVFLNRYLEASGDYAGLDVLPFYLVYRALVRAKVTAITQSQTAGAPVTDGVAPYLELALACAMPADPPRLIVMRGLSGSGKTFVTERLLATLPAVRLRSDVIRKQRAGLQALARSHSAPGTGLYTEDATRASYARLRDLAACGLRAGFTVLIDAACLRQWQRQLFLDLAHQQRCPVAIVACEADPATLRARVARRSAAGTDASEADLEILAHQLRDHEPLTAAESAHAIRVDTTRPLTIDALAADIRRTTGMG